MRFSILINCHNQSNYIDECILSSLNQSYEDFEVIVVDSSDIKLNLEKFKSHKNFKYFHIEKFSKYPEVNQMHKIELGFKEASGDYICLLDGDDKFSDKKLYDLNEYIKSNDIIINFFSTRKKAWSILDNKFVFREFLIDLLIKCS